jgi:DNA-directed RNA polymerase subunit M/transcription elongation factor TFIIS
MHIPRRSVDVVALQRPPASPIHVIPKAETEVSNVSRPCPNCGDPRAVHWFTASSGEHAGVKQERTIEHFRCTNCQHTWTEPR